MDTRFGCDGKEESTEMERRKGKGSQWKLVSRLFSYPEGVIDEIWTLYSMPHQSLSYHFLAANLLW